MWTCYKGRYEAASVLLAHGANPNVKGEVRTKLKIFFLCFNLPLMIRSVSLNQFIFKFLPSVF